MEARRTNVGKICGRGVEGCLQSRLGDQGREKSVVEEWERRVRGVLDVMRGKEVGRRFGG